jgi:hypothetical protein
MTPHYMKEGEKSKCLSEILSLGRMSSVCFAFLFIDGTFYNALSRSESKVPNSRMTG